MSNPEVSVIIPTFNRAHLVIETLNSIKAQTFTNWECLIIDDGSTDTSEEVILTYCKHDPRFKFYKRDSSHLKGPNGCRNQGLELSKSPYLAFCDDDDFWVPEKLEKQLDVFEKHSEIALVTGNFEYVESDGMRSGRVQSHKGLNHGHVFENMLLKNRTTAITPLLKREVFEKVGHFNEDLRIFEDWEFYLRVSYFYEFYALEDVLALVRKHPENTSNIVTQAPLEQYQRYGRVIKSLRKWGRAIFSSADKVLIQKVEWQRYLQIMRNHCPGFWNKLKFIVGIFTTDPVGGFNFISLMFRYGFRKM